jgi:hypothetical protein
MIDGPGTVNGANFRGQFLAYATRKSVSRLTNWGLIEPFRARFLRILSMLAWHRWLGAVARVEVLPLGGGPEVVSPVGMTYVAAQ